MTINIDINIALTRWQKVGALVVASSAVVGTSTWISAAPEPFVTGETLTAAKLTGNFDDLDGRLAELDDRVADLEERRVVSASAERTGFVAANVNTWTTIPGLSVTLDLTTESRVQMLGNGVQRGSTGNCHASYRYVVDGVAAGDSTDGQRVQVSSTSDAWHSTWSIAHFDELGPGSHTIQLQVNRSIAAADDCIICGEQGGVMSEHDSCTLNVAAFPI